MKRMLVLATVTVAGVLTVAAATLVGQQPAGEGRQAGPPRGGFNFPPVGTIEKVTGNLYWLQGAGGNTAVFVANNGVVLVDTKLANNGQAILDQVKTVTNKPVTYIINT